jgi:carbonic anhydrase/acetyltransferase-like protein (isoleucine patch superfamily)
VLRGDEEIVIGEDTNVQDLSMMHADPGFPAVLEDRVTVGHRAIVHGATVEDDVLVGMGAILLNGARIGSGSVIAAGAVVTPGTEIPENSLVVGLPAKVVREVRDSDRQMIRHASESYVRKSEVHRGVEPLAPRR